MLAADANALSLSQGIKGQANMFSDDFAVRRADGAGLSGKIAV